MITFRITGLILASFLPLAANGGGKYSWFDEITPAGEEFPAGGRSARSNNGPAAHSFGVNVYRSLAASRLEEEFAAEPGDETPVHADVLRLYGEVGAAGPAPERETAADGSSVPRLNVLGARWQRPLTASSSVAVSAEYGENVYAPPAPQDTADARAALSWTGRLNTRGQPGVTGSLFVGDEAAKDDTYRDLGRKYYGFAVGGDMTLNGAHTPYVTYRLQKSYYAAADDALAATSRYDGRSLLSAGWKWQVQPRLSLQAEARYGLGGEKLDLYGPERGRLFFSTRFDFR